MDAQMKHVKQKNVMNMHLHEKLSLPSSMKARNNMLKLHQENKGPSKTSRTSLGGGEAMIHHEYTHHLATL